MPELPEVETIVRTLTPMVLGKAVTGVTVCNPGSVDGPHGLEGLCGGRITGLRRRGKLALLELSGIGPLTGFAVHLKMTGRLLVHPQGTPPERHTRVIIDLDDSRLFFDDARKFGYIRALSPESFAQWAFWNRLGPEPLDMTAADFAALLFGRRAAIKALLLDQRVLAGIGNIYADESLFRAGIHPRARAASVPTPQLAALHTHLVAVLEESIAACGSSIRDYRTAGGDAGAFQNAFQVYGRSGQDCVRCRSPLESAVVAGRTTVFCPRCQPLV